MLAAGKLAAGVISGQRVSAERQSSDETKEGANLLDEQFRLLEGGEMPTLCALVRGNIDNPAEDISWGARNAPRRIRNGPMDG